MGQVISKFSSFGAVAVLLLPGACAPAPLYAPSGTHKGVVTVGEVPRDARGEPVWSAIRPVPEGAPTTPAAEPATAVPEAPPMPPRA